MRKARDLARTEQDPAGLGPVRVGSPRLHVGNRSGALRPGHWLSKIWLPRQKSRVMGLVLLDHRKRSKRWPRPNSPPRVLSLNFLPWLSRARAAAIL
jgi:hypothetical protein